MNQHQHYENLLFAVDNRTAWITLNRPGKRNAITREMHVEMRSVLAEVERAIDATDEVRVVVLTGNGPGFCAGQDLSERRRVGDDDPPPDLQASLEANYNPLVLRLARLPVPVVAAVNGIAAGAGANLAFACDIVIAARSASFVQPFCNIGLIPDGGGTWILPRLVGMARAKGMTFLGDRISAEQAQAWGLIWRAVDDAELVATASDIACQIAARPRRGFELQKQAYLRSLTNSLEDQLRFEADLQGIAGRSDEYREAVDSFLEKRKPKFRGG